MIVLYLIKGWFPFDRRRSQMIADCKLQIADDRKKRCFHIIADDCKRSQSRLLITFRTAEVSKLHASCPSEKIAANKWRASRKIFCCKQLIYSSFSQPILKFSWHISLRRPCDDLMLRNLNYASAAECKVLMSQMSQ